MDCLSRAPRHQSIPLPYETFPFNLRPSLACETTTLSIPLDLPTLYCPNLSADEFSRPATIPQTNILRIVHPCLSGGAILVRPYAVGSNVVTVGDVLHAIHAYLATPISPTHIPANRRADVISYYQSQSRSPSTSSLKRTHLLEGGTIFAGLTMNISQSNQILGTIDELQSRTWILVTREEQSRHIQYPAYQQGPTAAQLSASRSHQQPYPVDEMGYRLSETGETLNAARFYPTPPFSGGGW
ncbi:hypothetical protein FRC18_002183 [Serendipita sp. 400]|nr:hypothetical protein FRC18_002183 [Serendipita sp. 400]